MHIRIKQLIDREGDIFSSSEQEFFQHSDRAHEEGENSTATALNAGFTILFAVLFSSIVLAIGLSIFGITIKEVELSTAARESQFALYAADTGSECALYWEQQHDAFDTGSARNTVNCLGSDWSVSHTNLGGGDSQHTFDFSFSDESYCGTVVVTKRAGPPAQTVIDSRGYNTCDSNDVGRVERAIEINF